MFHDLEIRQVVDIKDRGQVIFARTIGNNNDFVVKEGSAINDIPLLPYLDIPRILDENGQPRLDVFVFQPVKRFPNGHFKEGQIVKLHIPD